VKVIDLMTTEVITARTSESLKSAARKMVDNRVSGLPVLSDDGELVGLVSEADFLRKELERESPTGQRLLGALFGADETHDEAATVGEVMARDLTTIDPGASLSEAARVMASEGFKRLPVVSSEGELLGVLSRADIVSAFTRPDEIIEDDVREDIARHVLFIDPDTLDIKVSEGVVKLAGELPARSDARILEELTRRLDGVVAVDANLTWLVDDTRLATS